MLISVTIYLKFVNTITACGNFTKFTTLSAVGDKHGLNWEAFSYLSIERMNCFKETCQTKSIPGPYNVMTFLMSWVQSTFV